MANFVKCRFVLIGNKLIDDLAVEMKNRIEADREIHQQYADTSRVGRLFYGLEGRDAVLGEEALRSKWIHDDQDYDGLSFVGGWDPVRGFQDHLLKYASKLDPKLIILMEFEDEAPNFVGARYVLMKNGQITEYEYELDMTDTLVTFESEYEEAVTENKESNEYKQIILWQDLYIRTKVCREVAFIDMKEENSWIPKKYMQRNPDEY
ncbi:hypothetical protein G6671_07995 [Polynucleobacter paneuropaeus]|nr:hypothetical protein G6671_07995 [Polynucleobacter paneuropaeus]